MGTVRRVGDLAKSTEKVFTVDSCSTVTAAARKMRDRNVGCLLVRDVSRRIVGILSERDVITRVVAAGKSPDDVLVSEIMSKPVIACDPSATVGKAQEVMAKHGIRHLPVIEKGTPVGMVSTRDLLADELSRAQAHAKWQTSAQSNLERTCPGITSVKKDQTGRVVI